MQRSIELLESKLIPGEGWPAEKSYFKASDKILPDNDYVNWGGMSSKVMNEWDTVDGLFVLKSAGRLNL